MPIQRRAATPPPAPVGVNFGALNAYSGGFTLPEGDYALDFNVIMHQATDKGGNAKGLARLGVMLTAYPLRGGEPMEQFLSMGSKAAESFAPDPETGKGLVAVAGGAGGNLNNKTNWFLFLKSLYDCGLPEGIFTNDFSVLDGIHVHTQNIPEPEDRKGFQSQTGEAAGEERRSGLVPVVSEIKDDGKPWEGGGGIPEAGAPAVVAKPAVKQGVKPGLVARKPVPVPVAVEEEAGEDTDDVATAAVNAVSAVLEKAPNGLTKVKLRVDVFKAITDADMKQAVTDAYFSSDDALNGLLGQVGYVIKGVQVVPQ